MSGDCKCVVCGEPVEDDGPRICDEHWRCPECGADVDGGFYIEAGTDRVLCDGCGHGWDYAGIERDICKKHGIEPPSVEEPADVVMIALPRGMAELLLEALKGVLGD